MRVDILKWNLGLAVFIHLFSSFNSYVLPGCDMPGSVLGFGEVVSN